MELDEDTEIGMIKADVVGLENSFVGKAESVKGLAQGFEVFGVAEDVDISHGAEAQVFVEHGCGGHAFEGDDGDVLFFSFGEDLGEQINKSGVLDEGAEI